jgi:CBS domain containing-hemolysin-like protein
MTLLLLIVLVALSVSFVCSILEATLLSARLPALLDRRDHGDTGAALLIEIKQQGIDDAISAILILNTIAHTIGAALAGAQAAVVFGDHWVGVFSGILTLLVLVATEIVPKTLGTTYASQLAGAVARVIKVLRVALAPVLFLTRSVTRLISHGAAPGVSRSEVTALVALATKQGALRAHESEVVSNMLRLEVVTVSDVMTPRTVAATLPVETTVHEFVADDSVAPFSRIPVFEGSEDNMTGYVLTRDVLRHVASGLQSETLRAFVRPVRHVQETSRLATVLRLLLEEGEHLVVVIDEFGGAAGIVTLEDVIETILGVEIVDESDEVPDLRVLAKQLRDDRLKRRRQSGANP